MKVWKAALGTEKFNRLKDFMTLLDSTSRIIYTNSQTPFLIEAGRILEQGGLSEYISKMPTSKLGWLKWFLSKFDPVKNPNFSSQLADAMMNPANAEKVTKLQQMKNGPKKALETLKWLSNSVFKEEAIRRENK